MFTKQTFDNNIYMKIFRWLYILFIGNLGLLLVNIPFFIAVISLDIDPRNLPFCSNVVADRGRDDCTFRLNRYF